MGLDDDTTKWLYVEAIIRYGTYGEMPDFADSKNAAYLNGLWKLTIPTLERSIKNYQNRIDKRKERINKDKDTDKDKEKDRDRDKDRDLERIENELETNQERMRNESEKREAEPRFSPPSLDEIKKYIIENELSYTSADSFYDYYTSCGWVIGNNKRMKDWKAAIRRWDKKEREEKYNSTNPDDRLHNAARSVEEFYGRFNTSPKPDRLHVSARTPEDYEGDF